LRKITSAVLAAFLVFALASCGDGSGAGVGGSSELSRFVGKWESPILAGLFEYKANGTWTCTYEGEILRGGTFRLDTYEGRSVFVEHTNPYTNSYASTPYPTDWVYDFQFKNNDNELHLNWLFNAGGNTVIPDRKYEVFTRVK
jgi:hypothetical protein